MHVTGDQFLLRPLILWSWKNAFCYSFQVPSQTLHNYFWNSANDNPLDPLFWLSWSMDSPLLNDIFLLYFLPLRLKGPLQDLDPHVLRPMLCRLFELNGATSYYVPLIGANDVTSGSFHESFRGSSELNHSWRVFLATCDIPRYIHKCLLSLTEMSRSDNGQCIYSFSREELVLFRSSGRSQKSRKVHGSCHWSDEILIMSGSPSSSRYPSWSWNELPRATSWPNPSSFSYRSASVATCSVSAPDLSPHASY